MELTGRNQVNLTNDGSEDNQEPAWSPDGTQIAWRRDMNIWMMNADGSNKRQLTSGLGARTPKWSSDGQWICFIAWPPGETQYVDVYIVAASGGTPINVTHSPRNDLQASWSTDSREIVFETDRHSVFTGTHVITANWEIYTVNISTSIQTRLTDDPDQDHAAAWSPDGAQIAWLSDRGNAQYDYGIWVMAADGSLAHRLTPPLHLSGSIAWSPDSRRLSVASNIYLNGDIYVIDVASGQFEQITTPALQGVAPVWRPDTWR
jgi:TolB protein